MPNSLEMMSVREYPRLKRRGRQVLAIDTLTADEASELLAALQASRPNEATAALDRELDGWTP